MSLFDDTKKTGLAIWAASILMILDSILFILYELTNSLVKTNGLRFHLTVIGFGILICSFVYFTYAQSIRRGSIADKFAIVTKFVLVYAVTAIILGISVIVCGVTSQHFILFAIAGLFVIGVGAVTLFIYKAITNEKVGFFDRIMWIALIVVFVLSFISSLFSLTAGFDVMTHIIIAIGSVCSIVIDLIMIIYMLDTDVRTKFGM